MRRKLLTISLTVIALGLSAWAYPTTPEARAPGDPSIPAVGLHEPPPVHDRVLIADRAGTISALDPITKQVLYKTREGVVSPSRSHIYGRAGNTIETINILTGRPEGRLRAPENMVLQVPSASGHLLAFAPAEEHGESEWVPLGRSRTKIVVVETDNAGGRRTYDLKGNYGIEAFSTDDQELFLIKYMPARQPWHYGLRRLDLSSGKIHQIARSKQSAPGEMNGTGRLALFSPTGHELYTLYTQQGPNYTHVQPRDAQSDEVYAFVHQLNLDGAWTHCIDLPAPFGTGVATTHTMAISDDGDRLYVADPSSGALAVIDPRTSSVLRSATVDLRALRGGASAAVSADNTLYLAGKSEISAFDGESLRLERTLHLEHPVSQIDTSADGSKLYVGSDDKLLVLDAVTGRRLRTIPIPGARSPVTGN